MTPLRPVSWVRPSSVALPVRVTASTTKSTSPAEVPEEGLTNPTVARKWSPSMIDPGTEKSPVIQPWSTHSGWVVRCPGALPSSST